MKLFTKAERATVLYEIAHVAAFNMTAALCRAWKFKYLFHDFEKPFLMMVFHNNYKKVQTWHRAHNKHHIEYDGDHDYEAMCIDWECSKYTKVNAQLDCVQTIAWYVKRDKVSELVVLCGDGNVNDINTWDIVKAATKLGLWNLDEYNKCIKMSFDELDAIKTSKTKYE